MKSSNRVTRGQKNRLSNRNEGLRKLDEKEKGSKSINAIVVIVIVLLAALAVELGINGIPKWLFDSKIERHEENVQPIVILDHIRGIHT
jgi:hypothetical protein